MSHPDFVIRNALGAAYEAGVSTDILEPASVALCELMDEVEALRDGGTACPDGPDHGPDAWWRKVKPSPSGSSHRIVLKTNDPTVLHAECKDCGRWAKLQMPIPVSVLPDLVELLQRIHARCGEG